MSVDKFGRYAEGIGKTGEPVKGPPGEGFKVTPDGNYDMQSKLLRNVSDALEDTDAVNLSVLKSKTRPCMKLQEQVFDARNKPLRNVANPEKDTDAVTLKFLKSKCVMYGSDGRISNLKWPVKGGDAVGKSYLDSKVPQITDQGYSFNNKRLHNVADPTSDSDAVNLRYYNNNTLKRINDDWNVSQKRLKLVADPIDMEDAVNVNYLVRLLGSMFYDVYKSLGPPTDPAKQFPKDVWMSLHFVGRYFNPDKGGILSLTAPGSKAVSGSKTT